MKRRNLLLAIFSAALLLCTGINAQARSVVALPDFEDFAEDYILENNTEVQEHANIYYYEIPADISTDLLEQYIDLLVSDYDLALTDFRNYEPDDTHSTYTQYGWFEYTGAESPNAFALTVSRDSYQIDPAHVVIQYDYNESAVHIVRLYVSTDMYMLPCEERPTGLSISAGGSSSDGGSSGGSSYDNGSSDGGSSGGSSDSDSYSFSNSDSDNSRQIKCTKCFGSGSIDCTACGGDGGKYVYDNSTPNYSGSLSGSRSSKTWENCYKCHGSGEQTCTRCGGSGWQ